MHSKAFILFLVLSFISLAASAGGGHSHASKPISQEQAETIATKVVQRIADKGKIDASWKPVKAASVEQKRFGVQKEWVVVFNNDKVSDESKRKLYVFLSLGGQYLGANYTGE